MIDIVVFAGKPHEISIREASIWSAVWIGISLAFCAWLWLHFGRAPAMEFLSGYLIEKSLSIDNLFVFLVIFQYFAIPPAYQHRVLVWGIFGALTFRGLLIAAGAAFLEAFSWSFYLFGAFLVFAGIHMIFSRNKTPRLETNRPPAWLRRLFPVSPRSPGGKFFSRKDTRFVATPLLLALISIEAADLLFAVDSIPAVFGVTRDPFIVFSSNACAIFGLRALYFVLAGWIERLRHLASGVAMVLLFVGAKMLAAHWVAIPSGASLAVIASILAIAVGLSLRSTANAPSQIPAPREHAAKGDGQNLELQNSSVLDLIVQLESESDSARAAAACELFRRGRAAAEAAIARWRADSQIAALISRRATVGIAVTPARFEKIRAVLHNPPLADVPPDQDALEFEWSPAENSHLDILTTRAPNGPGAIAKFLSKSGEAIQQIEFITHDVDRITALLRSRLGVSAIYPETRIGADSTRVNFFLMDAPAGGKILIELVEPRH